MKVQITTKTLPGEIRMYENVNQITSINIESTRYVKLVFQDDGIEDEQFLLDDYDFDIMGGYGG